MRAGGKRGSTGRQQKGPAAVRYLVGLDGAEGEVLRGDGALGERVEQGALADVGQTHDADLEPVNGGQGVSGAANAQVKGRDICMSRDRRDTKHCRHPPLRAAKHACLLGVRDRRAEKTGSGCGFTISPACVLVFLGQAGGWGRGWCCDAAGGDASVRSDSGLVSSMRTIGNPDSVARDPGLPRAWNNTERYMERLS